jgi:hypothetical protein
MSPCASGHGQNMTDNLTFPIPQKTVGRIILRGLLSESGFSRKLGTIEHSARIPSREMTGERNTRESNGKGRNQIVPICK